MMVSWLQDFPGAKYIDTCPAILLIIIAHFLCNPLSPGLGNPVEVLFSPDEKRRAGDRGSRHQGLVGQRIAGKDLEFPGGPDYSAKTLLAEKVDTPFRRDGRSRV